MTPIERVLAKVTLDGDHLLTTWRRATVKVDGRGVLDHRVVYEHHHGPVPEGAMVRRTCGRDQCVAEDHLALRWRVCVAERVLANVAVDPDMLCWNWVGDARKPWRVYVVDDDGERLSLRRWSFKRWRGPVREGFEVVARCGGDQCIHPDHLTLSLPGGTTKSIDTTPGVLGQRLNHLDAVSLLCERGHLVLGDNARTLRVAGEVVRRCRQCQAEQDFLLLLRAVLDEKVVDPREEWKARIRARQGLGRVA